MSRSCELYKNNWKPAQFTQPAKSHRPRPRNSTCSSSFRRCSSSFSSNSISRSSSSIIPNSSFSSNSYSPSSCRKKCRLSSPHFGEKMKGKNRCVQLPNKHVLLLKFKHKLMPGHIHRLVVQHVLHSFLRTITIILVTHPSWLRPKLQHSYYHRLL